MSILQPRSCRALWPRRESSAEDRGFGRGAMAVRRASAGYVHAVGDSISEVEERMGKVQDLFEMSSVVPSTSVSVAFFATAFGFGPVSKAVAVARRLRAQQPSVHLAYFGGGTDLDFAVASEAFNATVCVDVDRPSDPQRLVERLASFDATVSVMNEALPPLWPSAHHGLVMLDSLAWLWPGPPPGIENAAAYFVQDYMVPADRITDWGQHHRIDLVGPIVSTDQDLMAVVDGSYVLLNFNGSSSFIQPQAWFERIIHTITESIVTSPALGERKIVVATNGKVAASLAGKIGHQVLIANFPSQKMAALMRQADIILATPGITSTLEAFSLGLRIGLLPPLNYSQMLLSHQYYTRLGDRSGLAPGNFGAEFTAPAGLPEAEGVARTMACVDELLRARLSDIRARVDAMLVGGHLLEPADMTAFRVAPQLSAGADTIAARVLALATARAATAQGLR